MKEVVGSVRAVPPPAHPTLTPPTHTLAQDFANRFAASGHPEEAAFAATLRQYVSRSVAAQPGRGDCMPS